MVGSEMACEAELFKAVQGCRPFDNEAFARSKIRRRTNLPER